MRLLTGNSVGRVRGPVLRVGALVVAVLHLQRHRVSSRQLGGQVGAALRIAGQTRHDLPHRVLTSPERRGEAARLLKKRAPEATFQTHKLT